MFGFLNINKPAGPTSHDIVARVRKLCGRGVKVGHAGTLDPFAEGVLVVCVGPATRLADYVQAETKRYVAEITLGAMSSTDDIEGKITPTPAADQPDERKVREVLVAFIGQINQVPPAHSAVHVAGKRAYKLARAGAEVRLPARPVTIYSIELLRYGYPHLEIDIRCGSGTYIRSIARDVGAALEVGGYCSKLTRTEVGPFKLTDAVPLEKLNPNRDLLDPLVGLVRMQRIVLAEQPVRQLANGNPATLPSPADPGEVAVISEDGRLLAIAVVGKDGVTLRPKKIFPRSANE